MTVKVSKPAINVREELADLKKPTGIAGQAMLAAETPQQQFNLIGAGRRNLIINGDFQVNQRGTSISSTVSDYHHGAADRWSFYRYGGTAIQAVVDTKEILPDGTPLRRYLRTTSDTTRVFNSYKVEDVLQFNNQLVTLSGWVKSSSSGIIGTDLEAGGALNFGTGGSTGVAIVGFGDGTKTGTTIASNWKRFEITFKVKDLSGYTIGPSNTSFLQLYITSDSQSNATGALDLAKVQLELGRIATPLEHRSYGEELAACQRFYQLLSVGTVFGATGTSNHQIGSYSISPMRATPTATVVSNILSSGTLYVVPTTNIHVRAGYTAGNAGAGNYNIYMNLSAEL
jgi:hypothetical protein